MESSVDIISNYSQKIIENPEVSETRCRICYEESKPLITLCQCSGTIAYVHEECILDWITKKMETSDTVEIPKCEICRSTYSARLKIGRKKVCYKVLLKKIKQLRMLEIMITLFYIFGTILAFYLSSKMVFSIFSLILTSSKPNENSRTSNFFTDVFTSIIYPIYFVKAAILHGRRRMKLWQESMVQIVELTLNPKLILKQ